MDSYDNDIFLLVLDDDLFWVEDADKCGDNSTITQQDANRRGKWRRSLDGNL